MRRTIERALQQWQDQGLLSAEKVAELRSTLSGGESTRGIHIFAVLGAVLAGLGVILFVSGNWNHTGPASRVAVLLTAYAAVVGGAVFTGRREQPRVAEALWLLATLVMGANIFLIAQIYNFELTYWQGTLQWTLGALILGWVLKSRLQAALAIPLGLLTLGWLGSAGGWSLMGQWLFLISDRGLRPVMALIGIGLVSLSLLAARSEGWRFLRASSFGWGLALVMATAIISTVQADLAEEFFDFAGSTTQWAILIGVGLLLIGATVLGEFREPRSRLLLGALTALSVLALVCVNGFSWFELEIGGVHLLFGAYVVTVFALALLTIWTGVQAGRPVLVNTGMVTSAILILTHYFSWSYELLDRSLVFIFGGLLLLGLAVVLEKKRRALLTRMRPARGKPS